MPDLLRCNQRFGNFKKALMTIEDVIPRYYQLSELEQVGLIKRFKFTFDLAWKVMQDYLKSAGYVDIKGPRSCIKQMAQNNVIDGFRWEEMLTARNELSHIYDETESRNNLVNVVNIFVHVFKEFREKMAQIS